MKAALLKRLKRLEEVQATENLPPPEFQVGYVKRLGAEYGGACHFVTIGRDSDGTYRWEERPGPEPNDRRSSIPPFRVVLSSAEDELPMSAEP